MNKTTSIRPDGVVQNGFLVYNWLGSLWTQLFEQQALVKNYGQALGLLSSQLYLDFMETSRLLHRKEMPIFHRDRWKLLRLRECDRDTGNAVLAKLGGRHVPKIGPQDSAPFRQGAYAAIGGHIGVAGMTAYPLPAGTADVLTSISDSIMSPTRILLRGSDFFVEDDTLIFINGKDPFALGFPTAEVDGCKEAALWASDALVDKDYVYAQAGHVLGIREASSEFYAKYVNALWDLRNLGASLALVRAGIAAILGEPYVLEAEETVEDIVAGENGTQVITSAHVYSVPSTAQLRSAVRVGETLRFGELLTQTIRVYDNLDPTRLSADSEYGQRLRADMDALYLPPGFFRARLRHGLGATWDISPITYAGADANGNPKLKFQVFGSPEDVAAFWEDFWEYCESRGISGISCFPGRIHATLVPVEDATWGSVAPVEYFLYNYLKANLLVVVVDGDRLSAAGRGAMHIIAMLNAALPAHACLVLMERRTIPTDEYDAGESVEDNVKPLYCKQLHEVAGADEYAKLRLTYGDGRPIVHLIPKCVGAADENN